MQAHIDKKACNGCGLCSEICPEVFLMDADGLAMVIRQAVPGDLDESCRHAVDSCPVEAIALQRRT